ncbi:MAG: pentapeptide repeat-containing protein [[Clostridium] innocuum]
MFSATAAVWESISAIVSCYHNTLFTNLKAAYANLSGSRFRQVIFENSNFSNASFIQCEYQKTVYDSCDLRESEFDNTNLKGMRCFPSSDIEGTSLDDWIHIQESLSMRRSRHFVWCSC